MISIRKFCRCGVKLERNVADENAARQLVGEFWRAHLGNGHGPASYREYLQAVSRIVARNAKSNRLREPKPLLTEISRIESRRESSRHIWVEHFSMSFCQTCLLVRTSKSLASFCGGAALMKLSEFIGYPLPWFK
jgi:hypothetical protein